MLQSDWLKVEMELIHQTENASDLVGIIIT